MLIFEQEFLDEINYFKPGISTVLGRAIEHIANQIHRIIITHKERLPSKARKFKFPTVLWTLLPEHYDWKNMNEYRGKLNTSIKNTVSLFREFETLDPEWDDCDRGMFTKGTLNARGISAYWYGINTAFEKWDKAQMKAAKGGPGKLLTSSCGGMKKPNKHREVVSDQKKFSWNPNKTKFKLPTYKNGGTH